MQNEDLALILGYFFKFILAFILDYVKIFSRKNFGSILFYLI